MTVATFASAFHHMESFGNRCDLVVDAAHHFGTGASDETLELCTASARIGLTATPPTTHQQRTRLEELIGPEVYRQSISDLTGEYLAPLRVVTLVLDLTCRERPEYAREVAAYQPVARQFFRYAPRASWRDFQSAAIRTDGGRRALAAWRRSRKYGRPLGSLVPLLRMGSLLLGAEATLRGRDLIVRLRSADPIFPGLPTPSRYDSQLEERFARDFRRLAPDWDLIREPEPLRAGSHLIFPDFAIFHRRNRARCVLLEGVGFWTPRYRRSKLERLRDAGAPSLILCIDESLNCAQGEFPEGAHVIRYKRRIAPSRFSGWSRP